MCMGRGGGGEWVVIYTRESYLTYYRHVLTCVSVYVCVLVCITNLL